MNTKIVKRRATGSAQTCASASRKVGLGSEAGAAVGVVCPAPSSPHVARNVTAMATTDTAEETSTSRSGEYGSSNVPATPAVTAKPTIIISHTVVAAAARRGASTRAAKSTSSDVPLALTPIPMRPNASTASAMPDPGLLSMHAVAMAASAPPVESTATPPTIHGVRRWPISEP